MSVGNVYRLGRDQAICDTSEYDTHRVNGVTGGLILRVSIDDVNIEGVQSCNLTYNFFDLHQQQFEKRKRSLEKLPEDTGTYEKTLLSKIPSDYVRIQINKVGPWKKLTLKELPEPLQKTLRALRSQAEAAFLTDQKVSSAATFDPNGYHARSSWMQSFDSDAIRTKPCIYFYDSAVALINHVSDKNVIMPPNETPHMKTPLSNSYYQFFMRNTKIVQWCLARLYSLFVSRAEPSVAAQADQHGTATVAPTQNINNNSGLMAGIRCWFSRYLASDF